MNGRIRGSPSSLYINAIILPLYSLFVEPLTFLRHVNAIFLHSFILSWRDFFLWNYSVFLCVCCWVETECIAVGGATTCTHAQYVLDVNLIHAGLWRPGSLLIPIITHLLSWYVNDRLRPSKHSITSEAKSHSFFTGPFLHALWVVPCSVRLPRSL